MTETAADLVELGRSLFERRLTFGRTGNLSLRRADGQIVITPSGVSLGKLAEGELSEIDLLGAHVAGPPPSKEAFLHAAVYRARPGARGVVHLHSTFAVAASLLADTPSDDALPPLTAYYAMRVGRLPLVPYHAPGDPRLEPLASRLAVDHHAFLLANHGPVVAGVDLASAVDAAEELEETARLHVLLRGQLLRPLTEAQAAPLRPRHDTLRDNR